MDEGKDHEANEAPNVACVEDLCKEHILSVEQDEWAQLALEP